MARKTKQDKLIDSQVESAFNRHGKNIQFNIMDLGKIHDAGVRAAQAGNDVDEAVILAIEQYRQN